MPDSSPVRVLALVSAPEMGGAVLRYAGALSRAREARLCALCAQGTPSPVGPAAPSELIYVAGSPATLRAKASEIAAQASPAMVVADWCPDPRELSATLSLTLDLHVPGVFVRENPSQQTRRILVPTTGGPHVVKQLWVANELARELDVPIQLLQVIARHDAEEQRQRGGDALASARRRLAGITEPLDVIVAEDAVAGIRESTQPGDLIVLGAPNYWRVAHEFAGSIPDRVAKALSNSLLMLLTPKAARLRLQDIFWEEMILLNMAPRNRREALAMLVDVLVEHGQLPAQWRDPVLESAVAREDALSTAVGCETALPHVTIRDFGGLIGCFGICPRGVTFGQGQLTRFIFLLITPARAYGEYLNVLAMIARLVLQPETRARLLACKSPAEVSAILAEARR